MIWVLSCVQQLTDGKKRWGIADCALISVLSQLLKELKKKNEELEKERLANVPMDTAKEIKNLQNKIVSPLLLSIQYVNVGGLSLVAVTHLPKTFISEAKGCSVYNSNSLKSGFVFFCSVCLCFLLLFVFVFFCCVCLCFLLLCFFVFVCCVCLCFLLLWFFVFVCCVCLCFCLLCLSLFSSAVFVFAFFWQQQQQKRPKHQTPKANNIHLYPCPAPVNHTCFLSFSLFLLEFV